MGRTCGSPNLEYRWEFIIYEPNTNNGEEKMILWSKKYISIKEMSDDMKGSFSKSQLTSYASKSRTCPKILEIRRIMENVT